MDDKLFCRHCGKQITVDSQFCQYCGSKVDKATSSEPIGDDYDNQNSDKQDEEVRQKTPTARSSSMSLLSIFLWSLAICALCTVSYAVVRSEDAKPYDSTHYWGSSAYDTEGLLWGDDYGDQLTWMRKSGYEKGIKNMALYSFPISFGVLVIIALARKSGDNKK